MKIWENHSTTEILKSIEQEIAKAQNEINCAHKDIEKAKRRIAFSLTAIHYFKKKDI